MLGKGRRSVKLRRFSHADSYDILSIVLQLIQQPAASGQHILPGSFEVTRIPRVSHIAGAAGILHQQVHLAIGYPSLPQEHALADALQTANSVLGGGMSSRLFQEVREKMGLAYSVYSYVSSFQECGSLIVYAGVNPASADKAYEAIGAVIDQMRKKGITKEEFLRGREQMKSSMLFSQESTPSQMLMYGKYMLFNDKLFDFEGKLESINKVTEADVKDAIALTLNENGKAVGAVGNLDKPFSL